MKKVLYKGITKTVAYILIMILAFTALWQFADLVPAFERVNSISDAPENKLRNSMYNVFGYVFNEMEKAEGEEPQAPNADYSENTGDAYNRYNEDTNTDFNRFNYQEIKLLNNFEYYAVNKNGRVFSNIPEIERPALENMLSASDSVVFDEYINEGGVILLQYQGNLTIYHSYDYGYYFYDLPEEDFTICVKPTEAYMTEYNNEIATRDTEEYYNNSIIEGIAMVIAILAVGILIIAFYLFWVCGRKDEDEKIHMLLIDRMYVEILFAVGFCILMMTFIAMVALIKIRIDGNNTVIAPVLFSAAGTFGGSLLLGILLSFVRNIKNHSFLERSVIFKMISWLWQKAKKYLVFAKKAVSFKTGLTVAIFIAGYAILMMLFRHSIFMQFVLSCVMIAVVLKSIAGFEELKKGIEEIGKGNTSYKINNFETGIVGNLCRTVDNLGDGMNAAVERQLAAERMKTQLITNVSHDLKTPLTSIINYSEILKEMELLPEEANDYVAIIENKALKLKTLTSDLFEISKVQSGNEVLNIEDIDISILIKQSMGELDDEIKESGLEFNVNLADECIIKGDGDKLSRVFENLFVNTLKYSLKGTRVYVAAKKEGYNIFIEIKNISSYPLDFDENEITERFVRGDASRTTEGNGLGLAIAKSYVEAMKGKFIVHTDGDLFKVIIEF